MLSPGRYDRWHGGALAAAVVLCGWLASFPAAAQSQLIDLVGIWASKSVSGPFTFTSIYQVTTGPASLTMRLTSSDMTPHPQGFRGTEDVHKLYQLSVTGRDLSGTVVVSNSPASGCRTPRTTFPVRGRISPDWQTITIIDTSPHVPLDSPCRWVKAANETVIVFGRYR